jgi:hypothetical protein
MMAAISIFKCRKVDGISVSSILPPSKVIVSKRIKKLL